ncbi:hypothetical protein ACFDTO_17360 [Microbacteriaceae bacterium 4G12]
MRRADDNRREACASIADVANGKRPVEGSPKAGSEDASAAKGISTFVASVFDQLSVTSWLPSVCLVSSGAVLLALQGQNQLSLSEAIGDLLSLGWGALVLVLFALTLSAIFIQGFEFEALRFLEGYHRSRILGWWARRRIAKKHAKRADLAEHVRQLEVRAFVSARAAAMQPDAATPAEIAALNVREKLIFNRELDADDITHLVSVSKLQWSRWGDAGELHDLTVAKLQLAEFPRPHRILPTRLGNVMRASEDRVALAANEDLEGFVIRSKDRLPATIVKEHDAYRQRIEMYCGLVFVLASQVVFSIMCLAGSTDWGWRLAVPFAFVVAMIASYQAAIASALGFGQALREASDWLTKHPESSRERETPGVP